MEQQAPREWVVDTHCVRFEPPNLFVLKWKGAVTEVHAERVFAHIDALEIPRYLLITDVSQSDIPNSQARAKFATTSFRADAVAALVPGMHKRVVMQMIMRALNVLTKQRLNIAFFDDEAACRKWLAAENERLAKSSTSPNSAM
ncbi:MAG: hypothetical protein IPM54_23440 [Polyangiaceae bacterium]|nr:hypothetical protein [Polyangiaceae bacterium]